MRFDSAGITRILLLCAAEVPICVYGELRWSILAMWGLPCPRLLPVFSAFVNSSYLLVRFRSCLSKPDSYRLTAPVIQGGPPPFAASCCCSWRPWCFWWFRLLRCLFLFLDYIVSQSDTFVNRFACEFLHICEKFKVDSKQPGECPGCAGIVPALRYLRRHHATYSFANRAARCLT